MTQPPIAWDPQPPAVAQHPRARTALVLGIISMLGIFCVVPILLGPLAWYFGTVARREIEREPTRWGGHRSATVGMILGIIATVLLGLALFVGALAVGGYALLLQTGYGS